MMNNIVPLQWPAPNNVHACYTLRSGGVSQSPYADFNLGLHVGDDMSAVIQNREQLITTTGIETITWLD